MDEIICTRLHDHATRSPAEVGGLRRFLLLSTRRDRHRDNSAQVTPATLGFGYPPVVVAHLHGR